MADDIIITIWQQQEGGFGTRIECPAYVVTEDDFAEVDDAVIWANGVLRQRLDPFKPYEP